MLVKVTYPDGTERTLRVQEYVRLPTAEIAAIKAHLVPEAIDIIAELPRKRVQPSKDN